MKPKNQLKVQQILDRIGQMNALASSITELWYDVDDEVDNLLTQHYPFDESFDDIQHKLMNWHSEVQEARFDETHENVVWDDIEYGAEGLWSQVCPKCAERYELDSNMLSDHPSDSVTCGVKGCWNKAAYYIDFRG